MKEIQKVLGRRIKLDPSLQQPSATQNRGRQARERLGVRGKAKVVEYCLYVRIAKAIYDHAEEW